MPKGIYKHKSHSEERKRKMSQNSARYWLGKRRSKETIKKIIESQKGKHHSPKTEFKKGHKIRLGIYRKIKDTRNMKKSYEERKVLSALKQGVSLDEWKGFKSFEHYDEKFNERFKRAIRKRDNQICMLCFIHREKLNRALDVHHINYDKLLSIKENCISLCHPCHVKTNMNRKHWINFFQSLLSERYNYQYENNFPIINITNG